MLPHSRSARIEVMTAEEAIVGGDLHGIGPTGAARLLVEVGDITRFPSKAH